VLRRPVETTDSAAEQDVLTKRLCNYFAKGAKMSSDDERYEDLSSRNFLWFYTRSDKSEFKLDPISLDRNFLKLIMQRNNDHDIGVYPFLANRNSIQRIEQRVIKGSALNEQRVSFARAVSQELASERGLILGSNQAVILFSGYALGFVLALDGGRHDLVEGRLHAEELELTHEVEELSTFHQMVLLRLS
jgi:hypothetical protein